MHLFLSQPEIKWATLNVVICVLAIEDAEIATVRHEDAIEMDCPCQHTLRGLWRAQSSIAIIESTCTAPFGLTRQQVAYTTHNRRACKVCSDAGEISQPRKGLEPYMQVSRLRYIRKADPY